MKHIKLFEEFLNEAVEFKGYRVGDDFYYVPSTSGETRFYKILAITKDTIKIQNYDFVRNAPDKKGDKGEVSAYIFASNVDNKKISHYERGDLSD
jgi:hypothetical protein